jgi:predicted ribosome quality control (RQC) complex YloA/Tae2 family protein
MRELSSLEIRFLIKEIKKDLINSKIQKIKKIPQAFSLELYKQKKRNYLTLSEKMIFLSDKNYKSQELNGLGQILRKKLTGQIILDIRQHEFDRIVEIETNDYLIFLEAFGNGNLILVNKSDNKIVSASEIRSWKSRSIRPKREYKYPPSRPNPFKLTISELENFEKKEIVKVLATNLGLGGKISEQICNKLGIEKNSKKFDAQKLYNFFKNIDKEFENLENINNELKKEFEQELKNEMEENKKIKKLNRIRKRQKEALEKWKQKEKEFGKIGKLMYEKYDKVKKELDSKKKKIVIDDLTIKLDFRKSVQKNAEIYFEKAKKAKKKIEGLKEAMKNIKKKRTIEKKRKVKKEVKKEWYDKFRWFTSSDDFLIVGGKDAKTNEKLIRKYMKKSDIVFHTDITGSPFVLIKNPENKEIPEKTIKEAAEFCGSYSKAWKIGISAVDVYYIRPDQVKKEGGLPTGSFMIYGKRNWVRRIPVQIAIGFKKNELYSGPKSMVKEKTSNFVNVYPGNNSANEIALKIIEKLKIEIKPEKISRLIPYGKGELSE